MFLCFTVALGDTSLNRSLEEQYYNTKITEQENWKNNNSDNINISGTVF